MAAYKSGLIKGYRDFKTALGRCLKNGDENVAEHLIILLEDFIKDYNDWKEKRK